MNKREHVGLALYRKGPSLKNGFNFPGIILLIIIISAEMTSFGYRITKRYEQKNQLLTCFSNVSYLKKKKKKADRNFD